MYHFSIVYSSTFSLQGLTPNPDILCNREIKFKAFIDHAVQIGADFVATGHYASLKRKNEDDPEAIPELFSGRDTSKDQSYFLSNVPGTAFRKVLFPLGDLLKTQVREIASKENLCTAQKKDSVGICFIGKRNFRDFITQYIPNHSGYFYSVEGHKLERHRGYSSYTIGQGARIQGQNEKFFVVGKRKQDHAVIVAAGTNHPALFSDELFVQSNKLNWISGNLPQELEVKGRMEFSYRVRYRQALGKCTVSIVTSEEALRNASALHDTPSFPPKEDDENDMTEVKQEDHPYLKVEFDIPQRGVTPQQALVLYRQDGLCYGGGPIEIPGKSYFEMNKPLDAQVFDWSR
jgi:tRNA-specific 2-thiouridylase